MTEFHRPRVYGASKLKHTALWHDFRRLYPQVELVSRWADWPADNPDMETLYRQWMTPDLIRTEHLILYAYEADDIFKGANQEIGAVAYRANPAPIIICSTLCQATLRTQLGQIVDTTLVHHVPTLDAAVALILELHQARAASPT